MNFSEHPPSKQWAALKYRGESFAQVWFKPEEEPLGLTFRIPTESFRIPGMAEQLTLENLLKAVAISPDEVQSWSHGDVSHARLQGSDPQLRSALPPPPQDVTQLQIFVRLKPPAAAAPNDSGEQVIPSTKWQDLETCWKAILGLEAAMETLRISMESLLIEMETCWKKPLTMEEKTYAPRADVAQWTKAKTRVHTALPKMKDFIHRSIWSMGSAERKRLEALYDDHIQPHIPFPQIHETLKQLEELRKDRQVLSAHGKTIYQECRGICTELQGALKTLQSNAANARRKKGAAGPKGRHF